MDLQEIINRLMVTASALEQDGNHGSSRAFARLAEQVKIAQRQMDARASELQEHLAGHD
jgi:hypothetical protein